MKIQLRLNLIICGVLLIGIHLTATPLRADPSGPRQAGASQSGSWYFTVSGDSRDCGDLIMPKIAKAIESARAQTPSAFYWHLGDLRNLITPDCDMTIPLTGDCYKYPTTWGRFPLDYYLEHAWDDFIQRQIDPFGNSTFMLGIGNHELYSNHSREDFRRKFQKWLTQPLIFSQQIIDARKSIRAPDQSMPYYHFVMNGVDFIFLDNAEGLNTAMQFDGTQIQWFSQVLAADVADSSVKTIIVGMHAALPYSTSSGHAMDATCQGLCSGQRVYDLLYQASIGSSKKNVYVLASHAHNFQQDIFNTPEHQGQVLPGWIIGTAGASQYTSETITPSGQDCWKNKICYGYLLVEVRPDGTINPQFKQITQEMEPRGNFALSTYCFTKNGGRADNEPPKLNCPCGAAN